ncbi:hypothetical protein [Glaciibacter psychrotolerans]|uniref:Uncharacterized protein n=1 Tax=Glaciibacter psychrotolerans TaxID=670054 RepID=A0A7Z0EHA0_9MICO|nr:hypothetical protein [Leifsonia psychrotolerans]NYJ21624.1 hypothetical protein [Leifsonia psychrotolerans]
MSDINDRHDDEWRAHALASSLITTQAITVISTSGDAEFERDETNQRSTD